MLAFASVYFFESGLFNGLRAIQIANSASSLAPAQRSGLSHPSSPSSNGPPPAMRPVRRREMHNTFSIFWQDKTRIFSKAVMARLDPAIHASPPAAASLDVNLVNQCSRGWPGQARSMTNPRWPRRRKGHKTPADLSCDAKQASFGTTLERRYWHNCRDLLHQSGIIRFQRPRIDRQLIFPVTVGVRKSNVF